MSALRRGRPSAQTVSTRTASARVDTVWAEGRPLRQALMFTPQDVLADVERALADLP